jgi:hypothetical protein
VILRLYAFNNEKLSMARQENTFSPRISMDNKSWQTQYQQTMHNKKPLRQGGTDAGRRDQDEVLGRQTSLFGDSIEDWES